MPWVPDGQLYARTSGGEAFDLGLLGSLHVYPSGDEHYKPCWCGVWWTKEAGYAVRLFAVTPGEAKRRLIAITDTALRQAQAALEGA